MPSCGAGATGIVPPSGRCCVIDGSGMVIAVCNADPTLDSHPEGTLVANETASRGDRYMNGEFVRPAGATAVLSVSVSATSRGSLAHSDGN